jgi:hypothetical protein
MTLTYCKNSKNSARFSNAWENFVAGETNNQAFLWHRRCCYSWRQDKTGAKLTVELAPLMG